MKLVASLLTHNELGRYLEECVGHLLEFCDEVRVLDDGSDDGTGDWLFDLSQDDARIWLERSSESTFYEHEGRTRQQLLDWTLQAEPTHVLAIDADEFVTDPALIRQVCEYTMTAGWTLQMEEVWELEGDCLCIREDGGWRAHPVTALWSVIRTNLRIADRALACGRVPPEVHRGASPTGTEILHFGWTNEAEREARHARYAEHDQGRFHRSDHLDSIMWTPDQVELRARGWPAALEHRRRGISTRATAPRPPAAL